MTAAVSSSSRLKGNSGGIDDERRGMLRGSSTFPCSYEFSPPSDHPPDEAEETLREMERQERRRNDIGIS